MNKLDNIINIENSNAGVYLLLIIASGGITLVYLVPLNGWGKAGIICGILCSHFYAWGLYFHPQFSQAITKIIMSQSGVFLIQHKNGTLNEVQIQPPVYVTPLMIVVHWRTANKQKYSSVLFYDSAKPELLTKFRVKLLSNS